jgi:hypothetical protein
MRIARKPASIIPLGGNVAIKAATIEIVRTQRSNIRATYFRNRGLFGTMVAFQI